MLYVNFPGQELRIYVGINIDSATHMKIWVKKPDGTISEWIAEKYNSTTIKYITQEGDLNLPGIYILQSYIEWPERKLPGSTRYMKIYELFEPPLLEALIALKTSYKNINVQTEIEALNGENTGEDTCNIDYLSFVDFAHHFERATEELSDIIQQKGITNMDPFQRHTALSHLIMDYVEMGNPDWNFTSETEAPGVSFTRGTKTGPRAALDKLIWSLTGGIVKVTPYNGTRDVESFFTRTMFDGV